MSASEPSTPKAKGNKGPAPDPRNTTTGGAMATVVMRANGSNGADATPTSTGGTRGHGRSVSASGAYHLNRHSSNAATTGAASRGEKRVSANRNSANKKEMMTRQDASESVSYDNFLCWFV